MVGVSVAGAVAVVLVLVLVRMRRESGRPEGRGNLVPDGSWARRTFLMGNCWSGRFVGRVGHFVENVTGSVTLFLQWPSTRQPSAT